jgi:hypothetical protein
MALWALSFGHMARGNCLAPEEVLALGDRR